MDLKKTYNNRGNDYLELISGKLSIEEITECVKSPDCGAISLFIGTTRNNFNNLKVVSLHYEAYNSMAIKVLKDICNGLREKWSDIVNIAIYHRLGDVPVTEASVIIAISSPHRQTSLDAVDCAINKLKELVPIWKKEEYEDGKAQAQWKENSESNDMSLEEKSCKDDDKVDPRMIQINFNHEEVFANINSFLKYRKDLNNQDNVRTYCGRTPSNIPESSCSRIDAVHRRQITTQAQQQYKKEDEVCKTEEGPKRKMKNVSKESKSHQLIQGHCRKNNTKTKPEDNNENVILLEESCNQVDSSDHNNIPFGVRERLVLVEHHIGIQENPHVDVFTRMKAIEDKVIEIENNCEEYLIQKNYFRKYTTLGKRLPSTVNRENEVHDTTSKVKVFSIEEIESKILHLQNNLAQSKNSSPGGTTSDDGEDSDSSHR